MGRRPRLWVSALSVLLLTAGCASRTHVEQPLPASTFAELSVPLSLVEFNVAGTEQGRGVILKLSRLPDSLTHRWENNPARIIIDIAGPTGEESPQEVFPAGDDLVTRLEVSRTFGYLRIIIDLRTEQVPEYTVHQMADYVMVRLKTAS
jgi:hypothetical protein